MRNPLIIALLTGWISSTLATRKARPRPRKDTKTGGVIIRDVAVIGGGASGTHAAIYLQKMGESVVLVEKEGALGGHTRTYVDPSTRIPINWGVQSYWDIPVTREYFAELNITATPPLSEQQTTVYADFRTGTEVLGVKPGSNYSTYLEQLDKYPYLRYGWSLPDPIPSDLLLTWKDFIVKYDLRHLAYSIHSFGQGVANILDRLTISVFKEVEESFINKVTEGQGLIPGSLSNHEIYDKAAARLGANVLLSSTVVAVQRYPNYEGSVSLTVKTPSGIKTIKAKKLLIAMPPLLDNMRPFDLDHSESSLFSQWTYSSYYVMLVNNTGLPDNYHFANANASEATYNIPQLPAPYQITATRVPGLYSVWYGSPEPLTRAQVQSDVVAAIQRLRPIVNSTTTSPPNFVTFGSHAPFLLSVSADAMKNRFYDKLQALQGHRSTWYTGAAFLAQNSPELWNFTRSVILPSMYSYN